MILDSDNKAFESSTKSKLLSNDMALLILKLQIINLQEQRLHQLEEKLRVSNSARDELQSHSNQQAFTISDLQTKNANLQLEAETLKHKIEDLNTVSVM